MLLLEPLLSAVLAGLTEGGKEPRVVSMLAEDPGGAAWIASSWRGG